jgi:hypothetical protein
LKFGSAWFYFVSTVLLQVHVLQIVLSAGLPHIGRLVYQPLHRAVVTTLLYVAGSISVQTECATATSSLEAAGCL